MRKKKNIPLTFQIFFSCFDNFLFSFFISSLKNFSIITEKKHYDFKSSRRPKKLQNVERFFFLGAEKLSYSFVDPIKFYFNF